MRYHISSAIIFFYLLLLFSCSHEIQVGNYPLTNHISNNKDVGGEIQFSILETGHAQTQEAFIYRGGSLLKSARLSHAAILVKHPKGYFLFDTGLGDSIQWQFEEMNWFHKKLFNYKKGMSVKSQLENNGFNSSEITKIIVSHLHWDHASGIPDFPDAKVITTKEEYEYAKSDSAHAPAFLRSQYEGNINWQYIELNSGPYKCFEQSCDYYNDGTIVFVKLPGHTSGSLGMFLTMPDKRTYFFTGDVCWSLSGFKKPAHKHKIPGHLVDLKHDQLEQTIIRVHQLMQQEPDLIVVPAHDYEAQKGIEHYPLFEQ